MLQPRRKQGFVARGEVMPQKGQRMELEELGHEVKVCMRRCGGGRAERSQLSLWQKRQSLPQSSVGFRGAR